MSHDILPENKYDMDEKEFMMGVAAWCRVICQKEKRNQRLTHSGSHE